MGAFLFYNSQRNQQYMDKFQSFVKMEWKTWTRPQNDLSRNHYALNILNECIYILKATSNSSKHSSRVQDIVKLETATEDKRLWVSDIFYN